MPEHKQLDGGSASQSMAGEVLPITGQRDAAADDDCTPQGAENDRSKAAGRPPVEVDGRVH